MSQSANKCCERRVPPAGGYNQDGDTWTCFECLQTWIHQTDEATGSSWVKADPFYCRWEELDARLGAARLANPIVHQARSIAKREGRSETDWLKLAIVFLAEANKRLEQRNFELSLHQPISIQALSGETWTFCPPAAEDQVEREPSTMPSQPDDEVLDGLYEYFDALLRAGRFEEVDALLVAWPLQASTVDTLLGLLTVTLPARSRLHRRVVFFHCVESELRNRAALTPGLLAGLGPYGE